MNYPLSLLSPSCKPAHQRSKGLTLIELLVVIAVLSVMGAMGFFAASGVVDGTRSTKLAKDVASINQAIRTYEAAGGSVDGLTAPQAVLDKLKTTLSGDAKKQNASAVRGALVDLGLKAEMLSGTASPTGERAVWNPSSRGFQIVKDNGTNGVREFSIDSTLAAQTYGDDTGRSTTNNFALHSNSGSWVWDKDDLGTSRRGATLVAGGGQVTEPGTGTGTRLEELLPPSYDIPGGDRSLASYPLDLILTNLNGGVPSEIFYAVDAGGFVPYTAGTTITVDAGQQIRSMVYSLQPDRWTDSPVVSETYTTTAVTPIITLVFSKPGYNYFEMGGASAAGASTVTPPVGTLQLTNTGDIPLRYQASTYFKAKWSMDGSDPLGASPGVMTGPDFNAGFPGAGINVPLTMADYASAVAGVLQVKHAFRTENNAILTNSSVGTLSLDQVKLDLEPPTITIASRDATIVTNQSPATLPAGYRIYYTLDGQDPGDNNGEPLRGTLYVTTFEIPGNFGDTVEVRARVYPPATAVEWFNVSTTTVESVVITGAEDFFVGGSFFHPTGTPKRNIARIQGVGSVDNTFNTGTGTSYDSLVGVVRRSDSGGVYAGGDFSSVNSVTRAAFVRLNANGSVDSGFNANLSNN